MLGKAATMSVEIENNPDVVSKEETFVKCTSKKKAVQKSQDDDGGGGRIRSKTKSGSLSDTELVTENTKAERNTKHLSDSDSVKPSPSKSVGFLSDANANNRPEEVPSLADRNFVKSPPIQTRRQSNKKRHHSVSQYGHGNHKPLGFNKRRRKTVDRTPEPQFLLGGSITDPLNLNSLADEEVSKMYNAVTPMSSPLPHLNKDPDPVIVPADITDPLKLNTEGDEDNANLTRTLNRSGKKKRKGAKKDDEVVSPTSEIPEPGLKLKPTSLPGVEPAHLQSLQQSKVVDKIVSPVVTDSISAKFRKRKLKQEPSSKISRALLIESDDDTTSTSTDISRRLQRTGSPEKRKYKRQTSRESQKVPNFNEQNKKFQYGNYNRYYGYRNPDKDDPRLAFLKKEWFRGKTCLDIGCNTGHVTLHIAKEFLPEKIVGIDIDGNLIGVARKNIKHCLMDKAKSQAAKKTGGEGGQKFPVSMEKSFGPISKATMPDGKSGATFPANVLFRCANFVLSSDALLQSQKPEYDVILCLSVTKWIHLNWGDAGIKRFFRRIFLALKPGGCFILEPQAWQSYKKKKKLTETVFKNFQEIQFMPDEFKRYLLSAEVGFSSCETIGVPLNQSKGFRRPMLMFTKLNPDKMHHHRRTSISDRHASESSSRRSKESKPHHTSESSDRHHRRRSQSSGEPGDHRTFESGEHHRRRHHSDGDKDHHPANAESSSQSQSREESRSRQTLKSVDQAAESLSHHRHHSESMDHESKPSSHHHRHPDDMDRDHPHTSDSSVHHHHHTSHDDPDHHHHVSDSSASGHHHHHHSDHRDASGSSERHHHHHHRTSRESGHHSPDSSSSRHAADSSGRHHHHHRHHSSVSESSGKDSRNFESREASKCDSVSESSGKDSRNFKSGEASKCDSAKSAGARDENTKESERTETSKDDSNTDLRKKDQKGNQETLKEHKAETTTDTASGKVHVKSTTEMVSSNVTSDAAKVKSPSKVTDDQELSSKVADNAGKVKSPLKVTDDQQSLDKKLELVEADSSQICNKSESKNQSDVDTRTTSSEAANESSSSEKPEPVSSSSGNASDGNKGTDVQCSRYKLSVTDSPDRTG